MKTQNNNNVVTYQLFVPTSIFTKLTQKLKKNYYKLREREKEIKTAKMNEKRKTTIFFNFLKKPGHTRADV